MFSRRPQHKEDSFTKYRATKSTSTSRPSTSRHKRSFRDNATAAKKGDKVKRPAEVSPIKGSYVSAKLSTSLCTS